MATIGGTGIPSPAPASAGGGCCWPAIYNDTAAAFTNADTDLFEHIEDLLDFSEMDVCGGAGLGVTLETTTAAAAAHNPSINSSHNPPSSFCSALPTGTVTATFSAPVGTVATAADTTSTSALLPEEDLPWDDIDIAELEWLSNFFDADEDSFPPPASLEVPDNIVIAAKDEDESRAAVHHHHNEKKEDSQFRTCSPVSVLELRGGEGVGGFPLPSSSSSSSSSSSWTSSSSSSPTSSSCSVVTGDDRNKTFSAVSPPEPVAIPGRARSKRPRPANFSPRAPIVILPPPSSSSDESVVDGSTLLNPTPTSSDPENSFAESALCTKNNKKSRTTTTLPTSSAAAGGHDAEAAASVRKCTHCTITKTPQWRAGPMGPKTLCNACGVRYKSGRLFPEYRPAASPTFVSSLHSNSHKKVVEMRIKASEKKVPSAAAGMQQPRQGVAAKACELLEYIRVRRE